MGCFVLREWPLQLSRESCHKGDGNDGRRLLYIDAQIYLYAGVCFIYCIQRAQMASYRSEAA